MGRRGVPILFLFLFGAPVCARDVRRPRVRFCRCAKVLLWGPVFSSFREREAEKGTSTKHDLERSCPKHWGDFNLNGLGWWCTSVGFMRPCRSGGLASRASFLVALPTCGAPQRGKNEINSVMQQPPRSSWWPGGARARPHGNYAASLHFFCKIALRAGASAPSRRANCD